MIVQFIHSRGANRYDNPLTERLIVDSSKCVIHLALPGDGYIITRTMNGGKGDMVWLSDLAPTDASSEEVLSAWRVEATLMFIPKGARGG